MSEILGSRGTDKLAEPSVVDLETLNQEGCIPKEQCVVQLPGDGSFFTGFDKPNELLQQTVPLHAPCDTIFHPLWIPRYGDELNALNQEQRQQCYALYIKFVGSCQGRPVIRLPIHRPKANCESGSVIGYSWQNVTYCFDPCGQQCEARNINDIALDKRRDPLKEFMSKLSESAPFKNAKIFADKIAKIADGHKEPNLFKLCAGFNFPLGYNHISYYLSCLGIKDPKIIFQFCLNYDILLHKYWLYEFISENDLKAIHSSVDNAKKMFSLLDNKSHVLVLVFLNMLSEVGFARLGYGYNGNRDDFIERSAGIINALEQHLTDLGVRVSERETRYTIKDQLIEMIVVYLGENKSEDQVRAIKESLKTKAYQELLQVFRGILAKESKHLVGQDADEEALYETDPFISLSLADMMSIHKVLIKQEQDRLSKKQASVLKEAAQQAALMQRLTTESLSKINYKAALIHRMSNAASRIIES